MPLLGVSALGQVPNKLLVGLVVLPRVARGAQKLDVADPVRPSSAHRNHVVDVVRVRALVALAKSPRAVRASSPLLVIERLDLLAREEAFCSPGGCAMVRGIDAPAV